jgi:hypothetical protein
MARYQELMKYKCKVPTIYKYYLQLGKLVSNQRTTITNKSLSEDRFAKLNELWFIWHVDKHKEDIWMPRFNELVEYKREFGHCKVPINYEPNPPVG